MSTPAIDCDKLSKRYGRSPTYALHNLTLQVPAGEVYGFLGPNGAGKSTTIRTLLNFIQPSGGRATILGFDIVKDSVEAKRHIGYLSGEFSLYRKMTGQQFLDYMAELQPPKHIGRRRELTDAFHIDLRKPIGELSKGNRQKLGLVQAFMHEPSVLILDEPTSGLDPLMQELFFKLVNDSKASGAAIFVSSHNFGEVQRMCDRVGFIRDGKLVTEETIATLEARAAHTFDITFVDDAPLNELKAVHNTKVTSHDKHNVSVQMQGELSPLFAVLGEHKVSRLDRQDIDLEQEFLHFYKKEAS